MPDDDLTATLDEIRERARYAVTYDDWHQVGRDTRRLVAAVEAVLKLADEWEADSLIIDPEIALREVITRELTKGEGGDGLEARP